MSSRLLTMKFMQRASASASNTHRPTSSGPPPSKKPRLSTNRSPAPCSSSSSSPRPHSATATDSEAPARETSQERVVRECLEAETARRDEAMERLGREKGETRWVLATVPLEEDEEQGLKRCRNVGLGEIDRGVVGSVAGGVGGGEGIGRRLFGKENGKGSDVRMRGAESASNSADNSGSTSGSESGSGESGDDGYEDVDAMIQRGRDEAVGKVRREMRHKKRAQGRERNRVASERRKRDVNLNSTPRGGGKAEGISSGGSAVRVPASGKRKSY